MVEVSRYFEGALAKIAAEPGRSSSIAAEEVDRLARQHEAAFRPQAQVVREDALRRIPQDRLFDAAAHLEIDGDIFRQLVELVVEERQPGLERMGHLLAVAEETKDVERHRGDPRFLHSVDHGSIRAGSLRCLLTRQLELAAM